MRHQESPKTFREADRRYAELKEQFDAGTIGDEEFNARRKDLMVQDNEGRWWAKSRKTGAWLYNDGTAWIEDTPPGYQSPVDSGTPRANSSAAVVGAPTTSRNLTWLWVVLVIFAVIGFIGIIIAANSDDDYVGGGGYTTYNSGSASAGDGHSSSSGSASGGDFFEDDFSSTQSGWSDSDDAHYYDSTYNVIAREGRIQWAEPPEDEVGTIQDATVEVDAALVESNSEDNSAHWGIICRVRGDDNLYLIGITEDRRGVIWKLVDDEWSELASDSAAHALDEDDINHIRGECVGSELTLYVNEEFVLETNDYELESGEVALYADEADVLFDNFKLSSP